MCNTLDKVWRRSAVAAVEGREEGVGVVGDGVGAVGQHVDYDDVEARRLHQVHVADEGVGGVAHARPALVAEHFHRVGVGGSAGLHFDKHHLIVLERYDVDFSARYHALVLLVDGISLRYKIFGGYALAFGAECVVACHGSVV